MKKVSVIMPVYAAEKYIAATLQSVLEQTHKNFELLIIDDGCPDKSIEICQQFTDPRIRIIRQVNRGSSAARNNGIRNAKNEYIAFLDADDLWLPEKLEKHVNHLENSPTVGVSFSYTAFIDEVGNSLGLYNATEYKVITPSAMLRRNPIGSGSNMVMRREVLEAIKFQENFHGTVEDCYFDEHLRQSQIVDFLLRITVQTDWQFEGIPELLIMYRLHSMGGSADARKSIGCWERFLEKARSYAPEIIAQCGKPAMAYRLRYLARKAVTMEEGPMAVELVQRAFVTYWRILLEDPSRTLMTFAAAYSLCFLPQSLYSQMRAVAIRVIGASQRRRIRRDQSEQGFVAKTGRF